MSDVKLETGDVVKVYGDTEPATNYWGTAVLLARVRDDCLPEDDSCIVEDWNVRWITVIPDVGEAYRIFVGAAETMLVSSEHIVSKGEKENG